MPNDEIKTYKDWKNFDSINFRFEFQSIDWNTLLNLDAHDPNISFDLFFAKLNHLIDAHTPTRKLTKKQIQHKNKLWITKGLRKSILKRDNLLKKYINCKMPVNKDLLHNKYKYYRNNIFKLIKS